MRLAALLLSAVAYAASPSSITLEIRDFATMPMTGAVDGPGQIQGLLARVNFMREEPGPRKRIFINDLNGPLYIFDRATKKFTTYLDFNGRDGKPGLFQKLPTDNGFANGFISFAFDPDYAHNGRFYTIHLEEPDAKGSAIPDNSHFLGLKLDGYTLTAPVTPPGPTVREAVLIEWTDTDTSNSIFEGTARELLRVKHNRRIHPMGDLIFNPTAKPGDPDWRVLYIACGDGGSGEQRTPDMRNNPQRLDTLVGKILRIIPDLNEHKQSSMVSQNGRYRIPNDNPFVSKPGTRGETWAYGFRNPARLSWDVDPANPSDNHLIANVIGLYTWEWIDLIHKGANYGYSRREGVQELDAKNHIADIPEDDTIPVMLNATETDGRVKPVYPVIAYQHIKGGGDAMGSGYVYRGTKFPALRGKYIFGDISTGNLWWVDYQEMLDVDGSHPPRLAGMNSIKVRWARPGGSSPETFASMAPITEWAYHARGGKAEHLPGTAKVASDGRSDVHLWMDSSGGIYILSKSDGMIRVVTGATIN